MMDGEVALADQEERVGVEERVLRGNYRFRAEARDVHGLEELVPVLDVERVSLRLVKEGELLVASLGGELSRFEVLTAQDRINELESRSTESERDDGAEQLVRLWLDEVIEGRCTVSRGLMRGAAEPLQFGATLVVED